LVAAAATAAAAAAAAPVALASAAASALALALAAAPALTCLEGTLVLHLLLVQLPLRKLPLQRQVALALPQQQRRGAAARRKTAQLRQLELALRGVRADLGPHRRPLGRLRRAPRRRRRALAVQAVRRLQQLAPLAPPRPLARRPLPRRPLQREHGRLLLPLLPPGFARPLRVGGARLGLRGEGGGGVSGGWEGAVSATRTWITRAAAASASSARLRCTARRAPRLR
jgi:hypothetical protein